MASRVPVRNIGPKTAKRLETIGIQMIEDIERLGVIETYQRLKLAYPQEVSLNALWGLQGAVLNIPWNELPENMKEALKQQLKGAGMNFITLEQFYTHLQGHRRLTVRTVEAFPEEKLFTYHVEGMRTFGEMTGEMIGVEAYTVNGIISGNWQWSQNETLNTKEAVLSSFHQLEKRTKDLWSELSLERLEAVEKDAWGMTLPNYSRLLYMIDNEIHHRAQGYVYLRLLGIEPPAFYQR